MEVLGVSYRILIADDEKDIVFMLGSFFESKGFRVLTAFHGVEALKQVEKQPDIILLDINMPRTDGLEVCQRIRDHISCPILFLTARIEDADKVKGFAVGGDDYIVKPFSMILLGKRIGALLRRFGNTAPLKKLTVGNNVVVDFDGYTAVGESGKIDITPKEIDLLRLLIEHKGLVLTRSQILDSLWGLDASILDRTIDTYIKNLRKKLKTDNIVTVKGIGYKYEADK